MNSMGSSEAAQTLFEQHGDEIYRYIRYTVGPSDADDIFQEVFLRVLQSWGHFNHKSSPKTWLWSIAKNCIREHLRKQNRIPHMVPFEQDIADPTETDRTVLQALEQSLQHLKTSERQVFVERVIHEKSSAEACETLGWSAAKVRTTLHRAIKHIQAWLAKEREFK